MLPVLIRPDTKPHDLSSPRSGLVQPTGCRQRPRKRTPLVRRRPPLAVCFGSKTVIAPTANQRSRLN